jgi:predicted ATPase
LEFTSAVTFFVGENGSGKSTLLEALADFCGLPVSGGGKNELGQKHGPEMESPFRGALRAAFHRKPWDGFFLRAEFYAHFASLLEARAMDQEFAGDPYYLYGGRSLHTRSHGESFMEIIQGRMDSGMFLLDEPESALSPQRQLALLMLIDRAVRSGEAQFVIATHSPILLSYPGATIVSFDDPSLPSVRLEETSHYQITRGVLDSPERYWRHLRTEK